ncbi:MAG TPA: T9SS type A sorting domain-containing protein, partial [bacterium]|nr:T9SS type A sorting domain-containing protein [bacterium]
ALYPGEGGVLNMADYLLVKFDRSMDFSTIADKVTVQGSQSGAVSFSTLDLDTILAIVPDTRFFALEQVDVTLQGNILDLWGNTLDGNDDGDAEGSPTDDYDWSFSIAPAGDFNADKNINFTDLMQFRRGWFATPQNDYYELYPFSGSFPYIQAHPDDLLNFDDLMILARMWNWNADLGKPAQNQLLAKAGRTVGSSIDVVPVFDQTADGWTPLDEREFAMELRSTEKRPLAGMAYTVELDPEVFTYQSFHPADSLNGKDQNWLVLHHYDSQTHRLTLNLVNFNSGNQKYTPVSSLGQINARLLKETSVTLSSILDVRMAQDSTLNYMGNVSHEVNTMQFAPDEFALRQNFPNPFSTSTTIQYAIPEESKIRLLIFDMQGRVVKILAEGMKQPGYFTGRWSGENDRGVTVSSGMYFLVLSTPDKIMKNKMMLIK